MKHLYPTAQQGRFALFHQQRQHCTPRHRRRQGVGSLTLGLQMRSLLEAVALVPHGAAGTSCSPSAAATPLFLVFKYLTRQCCELNQIGPADETADVGGGTDSPRRSGDKLLPLGSSDSSRLTVTATTLLPAPSQSPQLHTQQQLPPHHQQQQQQPSPHNQQLQQQPSQRSSMAAQKLLEAGLQPSLKGPSVSNWLRVFLQH